MTTNRRWLLVKRPEGAVGRDCFRYEERPSDHTGGADGQVLLRYELLLCAPTIRNWLSGNRNSYYPTIEIGDPVMAPALGHVIASRNPQVKIGARLLGAGSWQDEQWVDPSAFRVIPETISALDAMGILGLNALTAYCGLLRIGQPVQGEVLLVSGAAGSVGSVAAQIGRIKGCTVIALCGGAEKASWLRTACGIQHVIDYKSENVIAHLDAISPKGVDIYFDNVGGALLGDVLGRMKRFGRIVLCGQIATYNGESDLIGPPLDMMRMIYGGIRMQGFLARQHAEVFPQAMAELAQWNAEGLIVHREDVRDGLAHLPEIFGALFDGSNKGTLIARISDGEGKPL